MKIIRMNNSHILFITLNFNDFMAYKLYSTTDGMYDPSVPYSRVQNFQLIFQRIDLDQVVIKNIVNFKKENLFLSHLTNFHAQVQSQNLGPYNFYEEDKKSELNQTLAALLFDQSNYDGEQTSCGFVSLKRNGCTEKKV